MDVVDVVEMLKEFKQEINSRLDKIDDKLEKMDAKFVNVVTQEQCKERRENIEKSASAKIELSSKQAAVAISGAIGLVVNAIVVALK